MVNGSLRAVHHLQDRMRLSYKSEHAIQVVKHLIETGLQYYSKKFGLRLPLKSAITKALLYKGT